MNGTPALILLEGLGKVFVTEDVETHALTGINLEIRAGEFIAVEGPSGSGKTTLLSILGLLDAPTRGRYLLGGSEVGLLASDTRARVRSQQIAFIFQAFNLIGDLTVRENVELPLRYAGVDPAERMRRAREALERVGMAHRMYHFPAQLSGGQQQRAAVARAAAMKPAVLLADEPTGNLDSSSGAAVMELLKELHREGATLVMVTHDPRYARAASRTIRFFDGRVVGDEPMRRAEAAPLAATGA